MYRHVIVLRTYAFIYLFFRESWNERRSIKVLLVCDMENYKLIFKTNPPKVACFNLFKKNINENYIILL